MYNSLPPVRIEGYRWVDEALSPWARETLLVRRESINSYSSLAFIYSSEFKEEVLSIPLSLNMTTSY